MGLTELGSQIIFDVLHSLTKSVIQIMHNVILSQVMLICITQFIFVSTFIFITKIIK